MLSHKKIYLVRLKWHQDFPFYPQTNFDLISCVVHLDNKNKQSGALEFLPASHLHGVYNHEKNGEFIYQCTEAIDYTGVIPLYCNQGDVTFHHGLTLHHSWPSKNRRIIVFQHRAIDAVQWAAVIWRCSGYNVYSEKIKNKNVVRFPCGTCIPLHGNSGRIFDIYSRLKTTTSTKSITY